MLFDIHSYRKSLPPKTIAFASGSNRAGEIRAFTRLGVPVGVSVVHLNEEAMKTLMSAGRRVLVDSGAFSEVGPSAEGLVVVAPISHEDWLTRLGRYHRLGSALGKLVSVVVPDRVGNQAETLSRLHTYAAELSAIAATDAQLLLPMQVGDMDHRQFHKAAEQAAGGLRLIPAFPMNKGATTPEAITAFVIAERPSHVHLLGVGITTRRGVEMVRLIHSLHSGCEVSMDSNRLRAVTGANRPLTVASARFKAEEPSRISGEAHTVSLVTAGVVLDYTESISRPSCWASARALVTISVVLRLSLVNTHRWINDPDGFLQEPCFAGSNDCWADHPLLVYLLDSAWNDYVRSKSAEHAREAAIEETFRGATIAGQQEGHATAA